MSPTLPFPELTAEEAASMINDGDLVAFSGFTAAGAVKAVPRALAERARASHDRGEPFRVRLLSGASTNRFIDEGLARAKAIAWRAPYQASPTLRSQINRQEASFLDIHLSHLPQMLDYRFLGRIDTAVVEATDVTPDGRVYLTASVGCSPTLLANADRVVLELNARHSHRLCEMHDIRRLPAPPNRHPIPIETPLDKIGTPFCTVAPERIAGIVRTDEPDRMPPFSEPDDVSERIAGHIARFLLDEMRAGRIPDGFLPLQAGAGNVSNAAMAALGADPDIPPFVMYTEVIQDAQIRQMLEGQLLGASTCGMGMSDEMMSVVYADMDFFTNRIVLRPQELSNNPGVIRRLGVIGINTVIELDIYGCANSTHVGGTQLLNGIGGSGDFIRNCYLSIIQTPSTAKGGRISAIVPMCPHVDHNEHSVQVIVTEQGLADLRGLGPTERADRIIRHCVHPDYRDYLLDYVDRAPLGHIRHDLDRVFDLHKAYQDHGDMRAAFATVG